MNHLLLYEAFSTEFKPEMISAEEYQRVKKSGIHLRFSTRDVARLYTNSRRGGPGNLPRIVSWVDGNSRGYIGGTFHQVIKNVELNFSTRFEIISIEKEDEPFFYFTINWGYRNSMISWRDTLNFPPDSKLYGRMEYEEFEMVREDCKLWKDFCVNVVVEEDRKTNKIIQESFGGSIPDPELMSIREWHNEVTDAEEVPFNQKEKELFIALSDSISLENKFNQPTITRSSLSFNLINGLIDPKLKTTTIISSVTTYRNDDEFYYIAVWQKTYLDEKLYRCDGYECWEKFLKEIFAGYRELISKQTKTNESIFNEVPDPEPMNIYEWDREVSEDKEVDFTQNEKEFFIALSDTIPSKHKIDALYIEDFQLSFSMVNGKDPIFPNIRFDILVRSITSYKMDDEFYYVNVWEGDDIDGGTKSLQSYRCDGYKCWEKFLKEIFQDYRDLINKKSKTNESIFDEVPQPKSLLDENGDYIPGSSRARMNNREPFNQKEKSFINKLLETLNEEYISTNFSDNTEFALNMGEMGETTHGMRVVKLTDDYYEVQYNNYVDSDDEYIYCECDGFECLSKLLIRLFEKINKDYDYEGNT